jgi:hypothetical protein
MKGENFLTIFFLMITAILSLYVLPITGHERVTHLIFLLFIVIIGSLGLFGIYIQSNTGLLITAIVFAAMLLDSVLMVSDFPVIFLLFAGIASTVGLIYSILLVDFRRQVPIKVTFSKKSIIDKEIAGLNSKKPTVIIEDYTGGKNHKINYAKKTHVKKKAKKVIKQSEKSSSTKKATKKATSITSKIEKKTNSKKKYAKRSTKAENAKVKRKPGRPKKSLSKQ